MKYTKFNPESPRVQSNLRRIKQLIDQGMNIDQILEEMAFTRSAVGHYVTTFELDIPGYRRRGANAPAPAPVMEDLPIINWPAFHKAAREAGGDAAAYKKVAADVIGELFNVQVPHP